jgi:hypothetical protein
MSYVGRRSKGGGTGTVTVHDADKIVEKLNLMVCLQA